MEALNRNLHENPNTVERNLEAAGKTLGFTAKPRHREPEISASHHELTKAKKQAKRAKARNGKGFDISPYKRSIMANIKSKEQACSQESWTKLAKLN